MTNAIIRKFGKAKKAKTTARKATSFDRLWLACRLMTLTREEYDQVYKDLHGFARNILSGNQFASKSSRESDVPRLVYQLPDARVHSLSEKVRLIHRKRNDERRTRKLQRGNELLVGQDDGYEGDAECILKLVSNFDGDEANGQTSCVQSEATFPPSPGLFCGDRKNLRKNSFPVHCSERRK